MTYTFIATTSQILWRVIESYGLDPAGIFEQAGLDPACWNQPGARFDDTKLDDAWVRAIRASGDPCIGLRAASFVNPASLHALGYAWLASGTLYEALARTVRYYRVITDGVQLSLSRVGDQCALTINQNLVRSRSRNESVDGFWAVVLTLCRMSTSDDFAPRGLALRRQKPACSDRFDALFRAPVRYGAEHDEMLFRLEDVDRPLATANRELARVHEGMLRDYLNRLDAEHFPDSVRNRLVRHLMDGRVGIEDLAAELNMSRRSLQRRLAEENTSYTQLLDDTRRELAGYYINEQHMPVKEAAFLLGFSEPANFTRAFKRWTGHAPSASC